MGKTQSLTGVSPVPDCFPDAQSGNCDLPDGNSSGTASIPVTAIDLGGCSPDEELPPTGGPFHPGDCDEFSVGVPGRATGAQDSPSILVRPNPRIDWDPSNGDEICAEGDQFFSAQIRSSVHGSQLEIEIAMGLAQLPCITQRTAASTPVLAREVCWLTMQAPLQRPKQIQSSFTSKVEGRGSSLTPMVPGAWLMCSGLMAVPETQRFQRCSRWLMSIQASSTGSTLTWGLTSSPESELSR